MSKQRGGLGRGLGALIPTAPVVPSSTAPSYGGSTYHGGAYDPDSASAAGHGEAESGDSRLAPVPGARFAEIPVDMIVPNPKQPRQIFDDGALDELKISIENVGFLQPIVVRQTGVDKYEIVMGERRWRAAQALGLDTIPAIVRETRDDAMLRDALLENIHRANLNPLEEAAAYQQLIEDFGLTHDAVAAQVGRSRASVTNALRLLQLPPAIQKLVHDGRLDMGHARALLGTPDRAFQEQLAKRAVGEGLSVRAVEDAIREHESRPENGEHGAAKPSGARPPRSALRPPGLLELEELLGDHLDTRVRISMGSARGKVVVEFSTLEDLERIYRLMTEGSAARATQ
jgi:ParB family chromosome partitioning protein